MFSTMMANQIGKGLQGGLTGMHDKQAEDVSAFLESCHVFAVSNGRAEQAAAEIDAFMSTHSGHALGLALAEARLRFCHVDAFIPFVESHGQRVAAKREADELAAMLDNTTGGIVRKAVRL